MNICASKTFAKYLANVAREWSCVDSVEYKEVGTNFYATHVGDVFTNDCDYNCNTSKMKVIVVFYTDNCHAQPIYLTSRELNRICKGVRTADELNVKLKNAIVI